jgi:hypothetical protein
MDIHTRTEEHAFDQFRNVGREFIFRWTFGNGCLYESCNHSGITAVNFATPENVVARVQDIRVPKFINTLGVLMEGHTENN